MLKDKILLKRISSEIDDELKNISKLIKDYDNFIMKYSENIDQYLLRVKASFMADFYMGVEKIFRIISEELNGGVPKGESWHKKLLYTMTIEIKDVRPAVISKELYKELLEFLGFRHVVRQAYGFQLDEKKLSVLESKFKKTWKKFEKEIRKFCNFLEKL